MDSARILADRAERLARTAAATTTALQSDDYVTFEVGGARYAIQASHVLEVFLLRELSYLPGAPEPALGVTPWRGDLLYLIRLRDRESVEEKRSAGGLRVIVLDSAGGPLGMLVDGVSDLTPIAVEAIHPLPANSAAAHTRGITADGTLVLNGTELLDTLG